MGAVKIKEALLTIMDLYFAQKQRFQVKMPITDGFVCYIHAAFHFTRHSLMTGVTWIIVMFLSAVLALILMAPIHCRQYTFEQVMQC